MDVYNFSNPVTQAAFEYFLEILKIPRASGNERQISAEIAAFAEKRGLYVFVDGSLNALIKKQGSKGRENEPPVILQAHMDMVAVANAGSVHDFSKDPIVPEINGDWLTARGTSSGADNACGMAYILAVLADNTLSHPPIEAVFTSDEERGFAGASAFDAALLRGRRFINLDSENEGVFVVSCAGSLDVTIKAPLAFYEQTGGLSSYILTVKGLTGGHSGTDINKGRANAIFLLARLLNALAGGGMVLNDMAGGEQANAIPREARAVISFNEARLEAAKTVSENLKRQFLAEAEGERNIQIAFEKTETQKTAVSDGAARRVISGITRLPNGPISMKENAVWVSCNTGVIAVSRDYAEIKSLARFHDDAGRAEADGALKAAADSLGAEYIMNREYPAWAYKARSPLRDISCAVYHKLCGRAPETQNVHAGLECAAFAQKIPECDFLSFGPDIQNAHSPGEKLNLPSFGRVFEFLVELLKAL